MGLFSKLDDVQASSGGEFFGEGTYRTEFLSLSYAPSKDPKRPRGTTVVKAMFRSLDDRRTRTWIQMVPPEQFDPDGHERSMRDVKGLILALAGVDPAIPSDVEALERKLSQKGTSVSEFAELVAGEDNPAAGTKVVVTGRNKTMKNGSPYTVLSFAPMGEEG
jgi:hypothetical protein